MEKRTFVTIDGNESTANIAHLCNEVLAIYPITPSSGMGEMPDEWAAQGRENIFGTIPQITEMQSEAGAAGAVHGALQGGALTSTFTASQGLLLMIPNMYKIAGELTSTVFHVSARTIASHALSIFGDHSDVMACRQTGWGMLCAGTVQEAQDLALISYNATLKSRIPFIHFFDGFRTSHEVNKMERLSIDDVKSMIDLELVAAHRARALTPEKPIVRGTAQNPDHFFQARESCNEYYDKCAGIVKEAMEQFAKLTGREYKLFDYVGAADAEKVVILMGSAIGAAEEAVEKLNKNGEKVGAIFVRLYRPFDAEALLSVLPKSVKAVAVMDRTKEPGASGEPLFLDVVSALAENWDGKLPKVTNGRYGLSSCEVTPAMFKAVFDDLGKADSKPRFTVGIVDDVTNLSLDVDHTFSTETEDITRAVFYGLGSDGTVGANKNSVKIVGENTDQYAQGYFVYDSKKAGGLTTSHLRFSPRPIKGSYLVSEATFVACHQWTFVEKFDMLCLAEEGATFLLNAPYPKDEVWGHLPVELQQEIIDKKIKLYVIDGYEVGRQTGMGTRINTIMQTCFFALSDFLSTEEAIDHIKTAIKKSYGKAGEEVVKKNCDAVDAAIANMHQIEVPAEATSKTHRVSLIPADAPEIVKELLGPIMANKGTTIKVSDFAKHSPDGTFPTATTQYEKRSIALDIPIWNSDLCIQCGQCSLVCPHAAIRMKAIPEGDLAGAPDTFKTADWKTPKDFDDARKCRIQVYPDDCTGCGLCVANCPGKSKADPAVKAIMMEDKFEHLEAEQANLAYFESLADADRNTVKTGTIKGSQLLQSFFEFSGACAGCGETPYVKLVTQLFGDRMMIANATGCSSIYGGNLPSTPYCTDKNGRGPTWSNSLFEDNAEFGLGMRLAVDQQVIFAKDVLTKNAAMIGENLVKALLENEQKTEEEIAKQRELVAQLKDKLASCDKSDTGLAILLSSADYLIRRSVWSFGGDGWAYDIGFGGLDHVVASGRDINILVVDTEVYSNTGGQASKATPRGAVAKFAAAGRPARKKDLGMIAASYGNVFVGQISIGANPSHALKTILAAEAYRGPSLVIANSHCIAHGISMVDGLLLQKEATKTGFWPLYTYDPTSEGNPFKLASKAPQGEFKDLAMKQNRFRMLQRTNPKNFDALLEAGQNDINERWSYYEGLSKLED